MQCRNCGTQLSTGVAICPTCGTVTSDYVSGPASPYNPAAPANPYGVSQAPPSTAYGSQPYGAPSDPYSAYPSSPYNVPAQMPPSAPYPSYVAPPPMQPLPPPSPQRRGPSVGIIIGVAVLILVLVGGAVFVLLQRAGSTNPSPAQITPQVTATSPASQNQNPYPPHTGTLVLDDPMVNNSKGNKWDESTLNGVGTCGFSGGAYHIKVMKTGLICNPEASNLVFSNLAYEAKVTILQGDQAGIDIRVDQSKGTGYLFSIDTQGNFFLDRDDSSTKAKSLSSGSHNAIIKGLNQPNLIAIVANGTTISVYVNNQFITSTDDGTYGQGQIGVFGFSDKGSADVIASDARVWKL